MKNDLNERLKKFALRIIRLYSALPKRGPALVIGNQLLRSGTSSGAHYREAKRAKSDADFISKVEGALQELDETQYWIELLGEAEIFPRKRLIPLHEEAGELISIFVSITKSVKRRRKPRQQ